MAVNTEKMRAAKALMEQVDTLLFEAGVYDAACDTAGSFKYAFEDLDADIARAESGDLD